MNLQDLGRALARNWRLALGVASGVIALVMAITLLVPPVYESQAVLRIKSEKSGGLMDQLAPLAGMGLPGLGNDEVDTEIGVLRSRRVVDPVADSLGIHVNVKAPRRPRSRVLQVLDAGPDAVVGTYTLRLQDDGTYAITAKTRRRADLPERVRIGEAFQAGNMKLALQPSLSRKPPEEIRFAVRPFRRVVTDLQEDLQVSRQDGRSKLVEVTYRHRDPRIAAGIVNGIVSRYVDFHLRSSKSESRNTAEVLREEVAAYERQLRASEDRLQAFQEQQRLIAPEAQAEQEVKRVAELQVQRDAMDVEREALANLLALVGKRSDDSGSAATYRQLATFPSLITNRGVQDLLQALVELENARAELLAIRTESYPDVRQASQRIAELEQQLYRIASNYLESLDNQIASLDRALARFGREISEMPAREIEFARLARDQKLLSQVYVVLQTRLKEAEVQAAIDAGNVRVIDMGLVAEKPAWPKPLVSLVLSTILGLMLGFVSVVVREVTDTTVRSRHDAERATDGVPVLGTIPTLQLTPSVNGTAATRRIRLPRIARAASISGADSLVMRRDPWSAASEAYRALLTSLALAGERAPKVTVVTSALPGDGKSTVAANLALALAQQGARTLLIDTDLRLGLLHRIFAEQLEPGFADLLLGRTSLEQAIRPLETGAAGASLHLIPAGARPSHPAMLLGSERLQQLIARLREDYDAVILDSPPLNLVADAGVLGTLADATLLVARSGATEQLALQHAVAQLRRLGAPVGGIVLNDSAVDDRASYVGGKSGQPAANGSV